MITDKEINFIFLRYSDVIINTVVVMMVIGLKASNLLIFYDVRHVFWYDLEDYIIHKGALVPLDVIAATGAFVGLPVTGAFVGFATGDFDGFSVTGAFVGFATGAFDGFSVTGAFVGLPVTGAFVGFATGAFDGFSVIGAFVGFATGDFDAIVSSSKNRRFLRLDEGILDFFFRLDGVSEEAA